MMNSLDCFLQLARNELSLARAVFSAALASCGGDSRSRMELASSAEN